MQTARSRGRPREFVPDQALAAMTRVFRRYGFEATSLDMLGAAASMNRPSLYAAFGDKRAIYRAALLAFTDQAEKRLGGALHDTASIRDALSTFYACAIELYAGSSEARGCIAISTIPSLASEDLEFQQLLSETIAKMDGTLQRRIIRALDEGELSGDVPVATLSVVFSAVLQSLSIRARAGATPSELKRVTDDVGKLLSPWLR